MFRFFFGLAGITRSHLDPGILNRLRTRIVVAPT
jgi:hypothetical protein